MPARKTDKIQVACPHCGHRQSESRVAISTNCRKCRQYFKLEDARAAASPSTPRKRSTAQPRVYPREIECFDCGTKLEVAVSAESTMCKRCSSYVDLKDYRIDSAVSRNFKTKGTFVIESKGYVFNTEIVAEHAVIKGRLLGKLDARGSLTLHTGAQIKGSFKANLLIVPEGNHFHWPEPIRPGTLDLGGELVADVASPGRVHLRSTAVLFGDIEAANLVVEEGAVVVGSLRIGAPPPGRKRQG